jgi:hypothetical protein
VRSEPQASGGLGLEPSEILEQLVRVAEEAGIGVRVVRPSEGDPPARSGLCRVRGRLLLLLAPADPLDARIEAVAAALREHGGSLLEERFLPPAVRERLDRPARTPEGSR